MLSVRPNLAQRTSLGIGGTCEAELVLETREEACALADTLRSLCLPGYRLGKGTNIFAMDGHHELCLIRPNFGPEPFLVPERDILEPVADPEGREVRYVRVGSGVALSRLLAFTRAASLTGLEGLAGIPGSVGGSVAMNAGSFGSETCPHLVEAEMLVDGCVVRVPRSRMHWGYRHFTVDGMQGEELPLVVNATFGLPVGNGDAIAAAIKQHFLDKRSRQPVAARSAGCVFKNPAEGPSAGILLDRAGFRGRERNGAVLSPMHANFLVNNGGATSADALSLLEEARAAVHDRFGVLLEYEVRMLPERAGD